LYLDLQTGNLLIEIPDTGQRISEPPFTDYQLSEETSNKFTEISRPIQSFGHENLKVKLIDFGVGMA
jgi:hypothetical protein